MMFTTHADGGLIYLTADSLSRPGLAHAFTTRAGGVSRGIWSSLNLGMHRGDDYGSVLENYRIICSAIGVDEKRTVFSKQVHRDDVKIVAEADAGYGLFRETDYEADALVTDVPGMTLVVFSADCIPVLLFDPVRRCIGAAHAGWRGTALGTAVRAAEKMCLLYGSRPKDIIAAIGPGVGKCCYETDGDVPEALIKAHGADAEPFIEKREDGKWHVDLKGVNAQILCSFGLTDISVCDRCTRCENDLFWSHRVAGTARGSQAAMICLKP